ncbi:MULTISPECIES: DsrE family protein [Haloferax]|uniref:DsrE family protein n=1 Tax=Haloferax marinum TaxID=2666143 RepID=A0A6A8GBI5_9EURY|nr:MULTISPECIES: DsrE family protein [Haloferax]KAB1198309.1 DsrE family protein [Haloferax sp. CBA1150]MRW97406.1 DsrE family protein [Haloferax marinum]
MHLGLIIETNEAERIWNAFRLANTALDEGNTVEVFLLGDGVEAQDIETEAFNPSGVMQQYVNKGGELFACGTCLDSRGLEPSELRPHSAMSDLLGIVEHTDKVVSFG